MSVILLQNLDSRYIGAGLSAIILEEKTSHGMTTENFYLNGFVETIGTSFEEQNLITRIAGISRFNRSF